MTDGPIILILINKYDINCITVLIDENKLLVF